MLTKTQPLHDCQISTDTLDVSKGYAAFEALLTQRNPVYLSLVCEEAQRVLSDDGNGCSPFSSTALPPWMLVKHGHGIR